MGNVEDQRALAAAVWRTWGARGLIRRSSYEVTRRTGWLRRSEDRWTRATSRMSPVEALRPLHLTVPTAVTAPPPNLVDPGAGIRLYGGLTVPVAAPPDWHRHPLTGHRFLAADHWSVVNDADATVGDIKDVWELARFGWLHPWLRRWAATGDDAAAERIWQVIEDWHDANPCYLGPHWMCGQETSIRAINVMFLADALESSDRTDHRRRLLVAAMVQDAVGRVAPSLRYALSQRNNHASSEAGFLWTATVRAPWLPGAEHLRRRAAAALSEVTEDQFAVDGSYAQHSPTYQRVALHVLLWCLAVARATGEAAPDGVFEAVQRSVGHLSSLVAPGSEGRVPNLGGNDGALVFDLSPTPITDFRPILVHAAAATGLPVDIAPGPWDEEAAWFGLRARRGSVPDARPSLHTHALTRGAAHAVLRAGPSDHRPAHADQLHLDVWLAGTPVASDAGCYRYTALPPWANALAGEEVHNVVRVPGSPQAERAGRFFWRRWTEASVDLVDDGATSVSVRARLVLPDGTTLHRRVTVSRDLVVVTDWTDGLSGEVRWNLVDATVSPGPGRTEVNGPGWQALMVHPQTISVAERSLDRPASGWTAPTYGMLNEIVAVIAKTTAVEPVISVFATDAVAGQLHDAVVDARADLCLPDGPRTPTPR